MRILLSATAVLLAQLLATGSFSVIAQQPAAAKPALDYEFFKSQVQPVFATKRAGYTRCVVCHAGEGAVAFLQPLSPGAATWDEAQSRKNFEAVSRLVTPGLPMKSRLLTHPLEPTAGGDEFHNGGRQFTSQTDPQFQILAAWIQGKTAAGAGK